MGICRNSIGIRVLALFTGSLGLLAQHPQDIAGERIKAHVRYLSSDLLEGRGVGVRGGQLAEEYIAAQLAGAGVQPGGENGTYFQNVPMVGVSTQADTTFTVEKGAQKVSMRWQDDFVAASHRQKELEAIDADLIFVGHGIVSAQEKWDDYKGVSVKGKVVVLFTNEPQPDNPQVFSGRTLTYAGRWTYKFEEASRRGALGCIIIHTTPTAGYGWQVVRNSWSKEDPQMELEAGHNNLAIAGWLSEEAGGKLFAMAGKTVPEMLAAADSRDFRPLPLGVRLNARLVSKLRAINSRNVFGLVPGSDPGRKGEYVLFGAHWDHLGMALPMNGDSIYNGAIDNATGCGIVLETARAWASLQQKPRRSALFAFWTAEESGLRGAEYFSRHPLVPASKLAININYDAIFPSARTSDLVVSGIERTSAWAIVQEAARRYDFTISPASRPEQGSYYRSDHFMLARIGVPAFSVQPGTKLAGKPEGFAEKTFADFNANRYHQPSDEFREDWDFASLEYAAKFGSLVGLNIANSGSMPKWNPGDEFAIRSARP